MKTKLLRAFKNLLKWIGITVVLFFTASLIPLGSTIEKIKPRKSTRYWLLRDGFKIAYTKIEGDSKDINPPIVFLHGGPGGYIQSSIIAQMTKVATEGFDIYLYDQIGSGLSDRLKRPKDYSFERHLADLHEIIDQQINQQEVVLMGQSFGAVLAAHYLARYPDKVQAAIFTSPGYLIPAVHDHDGFPVDLSSRYPKPDSLIFRDALAAENMDDIKLIYLFHPRVIMANLHSMIFNIKWASDDEMDAVVNTMISKITKTLVCDPANVQPEEGGGGGYSHIFSKWFPHDLEDIRPKLRQLQVPCLILQGQCDVFPYACAYEYADLFAGKYVMIENAGHEIWWEQPKTFIKAINEFLKEH